MPVCVVELIKVITCLTMHESVMVIKGLSLSTYPGTNLITWTHRPTPFLGEGNFDISRFIVQIFRYL